MNLREINNEPEIIVKIAGLDFFVSLIALTIK